jgi:hypothetical protein
MCDEILVGRGGRGRLRYEDNDEGYVEYSAWFMWPAADCFCLSTDAMWAVDSIRQMLVVGLGALPPTRYVEGRTCCVCVPADPC